MDRKEEFSFPSLSTHLNDPVSQLAISSSLWRISSLVYPDFGGGGDDSGRSSTKGPDSCTMDMLWEALEALDSRTEKKAEIVMRPSSCNCNGSFVNDDEVYSGNQFGSKLADTKTAYNNSASIEVTQPKKARGMRLMQRALKKILFLQNMARNKSK